MTKKLSLIEVVRLKQRLPQPAERKLIRRRARVAADALGRELGVSGQAVHNWEAGGFPNNDHLLKRYVELLEELRPLGESLSIPQSKSGPIR